MTPEKRSNAIDRAAEAAHETNLVYCLTIGDHSQVPWSMAPRWQKDSARKGVEHAIAHGIDPGGLHESWLAEKRELGWKYGEKKDMELRIHPCFLPYSELSTKQRAKDAIFGTIVKAVLAAHSIEVPEPSGDNEAIGPASIANDEQMREMEGERLLWGDVAIASDIVPPPSELSAYAEGWATGRGVLLPPGYVVDIPNVPPTTVDRDNLGKLIDEVHAYEEMDRRRITWVHRISPAQPRTPGQGYADGWRHAMDTLVTMLKGLDLVPSSPPKVTAKHNPPLTLAEEIDKQILGDHFVRKPEPPKQPVSTAEANRLLADMAASQSGDREAAAATSERFAKLRSEQLDVLRNLQGNTASMERSMRLIADAVTFEKAAVATAAEGTAGGSIEPAEPSGYVFAVCKCAGCPFRRVNATRAAEQWCFHPLLSEGPEGPLEIGVVPGWCPLRRQPITVSLATGGDQ